MVLKNSSFYSKLVVILCSKGLTMRKMIERYCEENGIEDVLFFDGQDTAIMGLSTCFQYTKVIYSYKKMLKNLEKHMTFEEAVEFFEFNVRGSYVGDNTPVIMQDDIDWSEYGAKKRNRQNT